MISELLIFIEFIICSFILLSECCIEYTDSWLESCKPLLDFDWVNLNECPAWDSINCTARYLIEKGVFNEEKHEKLFNCFDYVNSFCNEEKIKEWKFKRTTVEHRWVEIFKHLNNICDFDPFAQLVEYALAIPGKFFMNIYRLKYLFICQRQLFN